MIFWQNKSARRSKSRKESRKSDVFSGFFGLNIGVDNDELEMVRGSTQIKKNISDDMVFL